MRVYELRREQIVPETLEKTFAFFSQPENLARITPQSLGFVTLTPSPIPMHTGSIIDYTIKVSGIRVHWRTLIAVYEPPHRFVDIQLKGPYAFWHHMHEFSAMGESTRIVDRVRYALPFGIIGRLVHPVMVAPRLETIFNYRAQIIADVFAKKACAETGE